MIRAILFDFNGVLVDDEPIHCDLIRQVLAEEGLEVSEETYYQRLLGFDDKGAFIAVFEEAGRGLDVPLMQRLIARKSMYYRQRIARDGYPFFPGATDLVRRADEAGLHLGVVSGALRLEIEGALEQENLRSLFKIVVSADETRASKPDPEGYLLGYEGLNSLPPLPARLLHPHEVLAIEDSPAGIEAAQKAGLPVQGVAQSYPADDLHGAIRVVPTVAEVDLGTWLT